jgi:hypothetical protein
LLLHVNNQWNIPLAGPPFGGISVRKGMLTAQATALISLSNKKHGRRDGYNYFVMRRHRLGEPIVPVGYGIVPVGYGVVLVALPTPPLSKMDSGSRPE